LGGDALDTGGLVAGRGGGAVKYIVITSVPNDPDDPPGVEGYGEGNLATTLMKPEPNFPAGLGGMVVGKHPVFTKGEIVIVNDSGREEIGHGRKPNKWSVGTEEFDNIDEAVARAVQATEEPSHDA
jgi:hypothetical protein